MQNELAEIVLNPFVLLFDRLSLPNLIEDLIVLDWSSDARVQSNCSLASLQRQAQSKGSEAGICGPQEPQQNQRDGEDQRPSEGPGVTNVL